MTSTCKYCRLTVEEHNLTQEKACHIQFRQFLKNNVNNKEMTFDQRISNRWEFSRRLK